MGEQKSSGIDQAREHHRAGRLDDAAALYRTILRTQPNHVEALVGLADVLEALGRNGEAVAILEDAAGRLPRAGGVIGRLADAHHAQGDLPRAVEAYRRAVQVEPALAGAWWGLGCALASLGDHAGAAEGLRRLLALQPDHGLAWHNLGKSLFELGQVNPALEAFRKSLDHLPPEAQSLPLCNIAVVIPGSPAAGNQDVLDARRAFTARCLPVPPVEKPFPARGTDPGRPLRLGYVSAFFASRNWMKPVWGLINHHDRDRFEVHLFSDGHEPAALTGYRNDPRDRFHNVKGLSNPDLARLIEGLGIDILVDLNAYSRPSRLPLFALRPAPVQAAWFNMFATSGLPGGFDYLLGDNHVVPPAEEAFYTERVVRLPGSYLTFEVDYPVPDVAPAPCLNRRNLTFGCLAPQYKITTEVVEAWSRILNESPGSRLILKNVVLGNPSGREFVRGLFARFAIPEDRVDLDGPAEHFTFLERYADFDVALDTFPYNGGTTTMEALWQGVPVLSFTGDRWASRISASMLLEAGLAEFVAGDVGEFIARGIALARDPDTPARLGSLRRTMRDRLRAASVCDVRAQARNMEGEYMKMWRRWTGVD